MNPVVKALTGGLIFINRLIDNLDPQIVKTIKNFFFLIIFIAAVIAVFIGIKRGTDAARIKDRPIAENANDVFKLDIKLEKDEGQFKDILTSKTYRDEGYSVEHKKKFYPVGENFSQIKDQGIIDSNKSLEKSEFPLNNKLDKPIEGKYRPEIKHESAIDPLKSIDRKNKSSQLVPIDKDNPVQNKKSGRDYKDKINILKDKNSKSAPTLINKYPEIIEK